jgi:hypothetical protein
METTTTTQSMPRIGDKAGVTCHDWFFCTKKIDKAAVLDAIVKGPK